LGNSLARPNGHIKIEIPVRPDSMRMRRAARPWARENSRLRPLWLPKARTEGISLLFLTMTKQSKQLIMLSPGTVTVTVTVFSGGVHVPFHFCAR